MIRVFLFMNFMFWHLNTKFQWFCFHNFRCRNPVILKLHWTPATVNNCWQTRQIKWWYGFDTTLLIRSQEVVSYGPDRQIMLVIMQNARKNYPSRRQFIESPAESADVAIQTQAMSASINYRQVTRHSISSKAMSQTLFLIVFVCFISSKQKMLCASLIFSYWHIRIPTLYIFA